MSLLLELRRRNVLKVAAAYALVAWILIEAGSVLLPTFGAPDWFFQVYVIIVMSGWVLALVIAWIFEITPEGVKLERDIVEDYHRKLCEAGVAGYAWERCWTDYRRGVFAGFAVTVVASMLVEQTERGDEMFTAMARRHARHALDLGADEFLAG